MELPTGSTKRKAETCTVILAIMDTEGKGSMSFELAEDYDTVKNKLFPLTPPTSSLENLANLQHTLRDGRRILLIPQDIRIVMEDEAE